MSSRSLGVLRLPRLLTHRKHDRSLDTETNLALEKARGNVSAEAYQRALARIKS